MSAAVHILATVRKPELLPAALLVFRTLRVGFPTAPVFVWGNGLPPWAVGHVEQACAAVGARFAAIGLDVHDRWIERLLEREGTPFWICDTDIVFWASVEGWFEGGRPVLAGRLEPAWEEEWTRTLHVERLHTCLMWMDPGPLRSAARAWMSRVPAPWGRVADFPFVRQHFIPVRGARPAIANGLFYDTCAGLWHAGVGTPFTEDQDAAFDHLATATYVDKITAPSLQGLERSHQAIYADHERARGIRAAQAQYYASRRPKE